MNPNLLNPSYSGFVGMILPFTIDLDAASSAYVLKKILNLFHGVKEENIFIICPEKHLDKFSAFQKKFFNFIVPEEVPNQAAIFLLDHNNPELSLCFKKHSELFKEGTDRQVYIIDHHVKTSTTDKFETRYIEFIDDSKFSTTHVLFDFYEKELLDLKQTNAALAASLSKSIYNGIYFDQRKLYWGLDEELFEIICKLKDMGLVFSKKAIYHSEISIERKYSKAFEATRKNPFTPLVYVNFLDKWGRVIYKYLYTSSFKFPRFIERLFLLDSAEFVLVPYPTSDFLSCNLVFYSRPSGNHTLEAFFQEHGKKLKLKKARSSGCLVKTLNCVESEALEKFWEVLNTFVEFYKSVKDA